MFWGSLLQLCLRPAKIAAAVSSRCETLQCGRPRDLADSGGVTGLRFRKDVFQGSVGIYGGIGILVWPLFLSLSFAKCAVRFCVFAR